MWSLALALAITLLFTACAASAPTWQSSGPQQTPPLLALAVDPNQLQTVFAGSAGQGVYRSTDGGTTWAPANTGLPQHLTVRSIVPDPALPGQVYLGTDQGLFQSSDDGAHWQSASQGLPANTTVNAIAINPTDSNTLYAGTAQRGIFISHDGARTWRASNAGLPANAQIRALLAVQSAQGARLYAGLVAEGATGAGLYRSDDGGRSWIPGSTGLPAGTDGLSLLWQPSNPGGLYLGTNAGIYRSADAGATWQAINNGLGRPAPQVLALALNVEQPQFLYAGTSSGAYRSADGGASWDQVATGLPADQAVVALAVAGDRASLGQIYAAAGGLYRYPGVPSSLASRMITVVVAGILILACFLLFRQQRRIMNRITAGPAAKTGATSPARRQARDDHQASDEHHEAAQKGPDAQNAGAGSPEASNDRPRQPELQ